MTGKRGGPVESVELRISIRVDRATAGRIKAAMPSAKVRRGSFEFRLTGDSPAEVARRAEEAMERLRELITPPKGFKNPEGSLPNK